MRRSPSLLLGLLILFPACSEGQSSRDPLPQAQILTVAGLDSTEVQRAVLRFLDAYARSSDDIQPLERAVGGSDLQEWVYWLEVQNRGVTLEGGVEIGRVRVLEISGEFAAVAVDATVRFTLPDGEVLVRRFESPFFLAKQGPGESWVVLDAVRDGRSMQDSIGILRPAARGMERGVAVEVASVFRFTAGTLVNIRVINDSAHPVEVDPEASTLDPGGLPLSGSATNPALAGTVNRGQEAQGMVEFPALLLDQAPRAFTLAFKDPSVDPIEVALPPEAFAETP